MSNTHGIPDMAKELQATTQDLLPACVVTTTWPTVPVPPSMTLAAFSTAGYVKDGPALVYCAQEAHTVLLTGGDGNYWLGLGQDTFSSLASWNRVAGTLYLWRASATRPPDVDGLLVFASVTVSGGAITAVAPASGVTLAEAWRARAGLGTMAVQNADAVAVTGGTATGLTSAVATQIAAGSTTSAGYDFITGVGHVYIGGKMGFGVAPPVAKLDIVFLKNVAPAMSIRPTDSDAGGGPPLVLNNVAGTVIGSISTSATATAFNTSSDVRLKHAIATLAGALERVLALRPVAFRWNADDSAGHGFLAHELQQVIPDAVSGEADAVNDDGSVKPQQVDHSKLVPWLTAACQDLAAQVQALTARVASLEEQLGL